MIVATAGHVDHGKTTLVRALTGVDTDRLPEEKRRGMSIDLGFAYLPVPGRLPIAFVDVPGHERFVRNMVAGIQAIDLALLVVAADDGPMPQTHEHLAILRALGVEEIWVVLTKLDLVDPARSRAARDEVASYGFPVYIDLGELRKDLLSRADGSRAQDDSLFRMHVDRAFVLDGVGVVVTGTVVRGRVQAGDELTLLPRGGRVRVRTVRANNTDVAAAQAGERAALGLHGVSREEVQRGDTLAAGAFLPRSTRIDVLYDGPAKRQVVAHFGTDSAPARLSKLTDGLARLTFEREVSLWHGDRIVLRDAGGATVLDAQPPARGASKPERLAFLKLLADSPMNEVLGSAARDGVADLRWFACNFHLDTLPVGDFQEFGEHLATSRPRWAKLREALLAEVKQHHAEFPGEPGRPVAAVRASLAPEYGRPLLDAVLQASVADGSLERWGTHLRLPGHRVALSPAEETLWQKVAPLLDTDGGKPARVFELAETLAMAPKEVEAFLVRASLAGLAVRVARNRFFAPGAVEKMVSLAQALDAESGGDGFAAAQFRDRSGLGRNLTIEVLEFLDECGVTKRRGERRRTTGHGRETSPVGRPDFKSGERRPTPLGGSTPSSSATT
jgi:selenocysteine-specific elongation factor